MVKTYPKIVKDWVKKILKQWGLKDKKLAFPVIIATLTKAWVLDSKGKLTKLGEQRQKIGTKWRAKQSVAETKQSLKKKPVAKKQ